MEEQRNDEIRPVRPRRRKRSKLQIFKEAYLPLVIAGVAAILILIFIIGSISLGVQKAKYDKQMAIEASIQQAEEQEQLQQEIQGLIKQADLLAAGYDYQGAIELLKSYSGGENQEIADKISALEAEQGYLVEWNDPSQITNLSFQLLIADPSRAFSHSVYGSSFNRNFITTEEFAKILQQLYETGYVLVSREDFLTTETLEDGTTRYVSKSVYLPGGKRPLMITQTNVNYNLYLIDSDGDKLPDQNGGGFASRLVLDGNGGFACEMVDATGQLVTGEFDLVPILERFIKSNPSFSYHGARATLALTGYNGLFGYRTNASAREEFGETAYQSALEGATQVADALRKAGYELAFYTYENIGYGDSGTAEIQLDLKKWNEEVVPILGQLDTIVFAQNSDIAPQGQYSGEKYELLKNAGFTYFVGFCTDGTPWASVEADYVRQGRILVTGANIAHHAQWFAAMFDTQSVLDIARGEVPQ